MPTKLEEAVYGVLHADDGKRWKACLRSHVTKLIVGKARQLLGSPPLVLLAEWDSLDEIAYRTATAGTIEACVAEVASALAQDATCFPEFKSAVEAAGLGLSKAKLANALAPEVSKLVDAAIIHSYAEAVPPASIWEPLANLIASEIHAAESRAAPQSEADCLHWSLLAAFFQATKIPDAARLGKTVRDLLTRGRFNIRGSLLRIVERTNDKKIADSMLPHVDYAPVALAPAHRAASQLVDSVSDESGKIPASQGFAIVSFGEYMKDTPAMPADAPPGITAEMVVNSRPFRYQQYEYSALSLSAIAAAEFYLRSAAEASPALALDARYASQTDIIAALTLTQALKTDLQSVFAATGPNFRNRSLHGGFLEIESRRTEMVMYSGFGAAAGVPAINLDTDAYIPRNAAAVALDALGKLDAELAPQGLVHAGSTTWTQHFRLDAADLAFATALDKPTLQLLLKERKSIIAYVQEAFTCLSMPVQLGLFGWTNPKHGVSLIQLFAFLAVMFEPAMRLVAHAAGFPILRRGGAAGTRVVRYRMLDENGFLANDFLTWIEAGLPAAEKADCQRTIKLAVRCRDAFAHGAIVTFDEATRKAYGAALAKSMYLLLTAATNQKV